MDLFLFAPFLNNVINDIIDINNNFSARVG